MLKQNPSSVLMFCHNTPRQCLLSADNRPGNNSRGAPDGVRQIHHNSHLSSVKGHAPIDCYRQQLNLWHTPSRGNKALWAAPSMAAPSMAAPSMAARSEGDATLCPGCSQKQAGVSLRGGQRFTTSHAAILCSLTPLAPGRPLSWSESETDAREQTGHIPHPLLHTISITVRGDTEANRTFGIIAVISCTQPCSLAVSTYGVWQSESV
ncbi:unnamed protein product [Pleuronectes platessa]|uniref:Uncharacterized protein n=1 Tax=Pleuronectes platessa TaxID=8262 RepID=A0A9N7U8I4_PLEPL|nr:unnamed protein product [Pleuronectes platessa]